VLPDHSHSYDPYQKSVTLHAMKSYFYLIITLLCLSAENTFAQQRRLVMVTIEWENFNTRTFVAVSCADFQSTFSGTIKRKSFGDKRLLKRLENQINKFSPIDQSAQIDIRGTIIFNDYQGITQQYCFDGFGHFSKGTSLLENKKLWKFISKTIQSKSAG
jgi:hypothetical protein